MPRVGHPDMIIEVIPNQIKGVCLDKRHQGFPELNKNKNIQTGIPHWQAQSRCTSNTTNELLSHKTTPFSKKKLINVDYNSSCLGTERISSPVVNTYS